MNEPTATIPARLAFGLLFGLAAAKLIVHLLTNGAYGFHRDESYYLACGRHLAWGYVDHPPLTPVLARFAENLFGSSLRGLRLMPAIAGGIIVLLTGLMARELGGRKWAQGLAALAVLASPIYLLTNGLFQTVTFDQLAWVSCIYLLLRLLRSGRQSLWLAVGFAAGVGLLAKYMMLLLGAGIVVGFLLTRERRQLRSPYLWCGGLIAAAIFLPNLLWQHAHGWPSLEFLANSGARTASEFSWAAFFGLQFVFIGVTSIPIFVAGLQHLLGRQGRAFRSVGVLCIVVYAAFAGLGGKPYYPAPLYPVVLAAGAVALETMATRRNWRRLRWGIPALVALGTLPTVWMMMPVVPAQSFAAHQELWPHQEFREMFGWVDLAQQVAGVYAQLPEEERAHTGLLTDAYGEAAALDLYGPDLGLPRSASGHDNYYFWGPPDGRTVVAVAGSGDSLARFFEEVEWVAAVSNRYGVRNEASKKSIFVCRGRRLPWGTLWPLLKDFI